MVPGNVLLKCTAGSLMPGNDVPSWDRRQTWLSILARRERGRPRRAVVIVSVATVNGMEMDGFGNRFSGSSVRRTVLAQNFVGGRREQSMQLVLETREQ